MDVSSVAPIEIWSDPERPQTLADVSFAPTSIDNVEFPDDLGPVAFQANRAAMAAGGREELAELESLNQQTRAYADIACNVGEMVHAYPSAAPCEVDLIQQRSHGITPYSRHGAPIMSEFQQQRAAECVKVVAPATAAEKKAPRSRPILSHIPTRVVNSVRGALYDLQHFNELPPAQSGQSPSNVTWYALSRDNRIPYLLLFTTVVLVIVALISLVRSRRSKT